jgi:hypothetical protein
MNEKLVSLSCSATQNRSEPITQLLMHRIRDNGDRRAYRLKACMAGQTARLRAVLASRSSRSRHALDVVLLVVNGTWFNSDFLA